MKAQQNNPQSRHSAFANARRHLSELDTAPDGAAQAQTVCLLLNQLLAIEWARVFRYRRHYFAASDRSAVPMVDDFLSRVREATGHVDQLAERIVQLGGSPEFGAGEELGDAPPEDELEGSPASLKSMVETNLRAEYETLEMYDRVIELIGSADSATTEMLQAVRTTEGKDASALSDWLQGDAT